MHIKRINETRFVMSCIKDRISYLFNVIFAFQNKKQIARKENNEIDRW